ncbi:hypothetical protein LBMAG27_04100 [Bacteroidota bacterium]|nr:hypothetical protein LBMAG27_04100 [Bacteroidota bacterium]
MKKNLLIAISVLAFSFLYSCLKPPQFSETPLIEFVSINSTQVQQMVDSIQMIISFKDGDGDLGSLESDTSTNCFITDHRSGKPDYTYNYKIPFVTPKGTTKDISGTIAINLPGITCIPFHTTDSVTYKIVIMDRAGHKSNEIQTPVIVVNCQ